MKLSSIHKNQIAVFSLFLVSLVVAYSLQVDWSSDYGHYYVGAHFIGPDYRLYHEHFDHKGPLIYLLLKVLQVPLGFSPVSAWLALATIYWAWSVSFLFAGRAEWSWRFFCALFSLALLAGMSTNGVIAVFQMAAVFFTLHFSVRVSTFESKNISKDIVLIGLSLAVATLIRPDSFGYFFAVPLAFLVDSSWRERISKTALFIFAFLVFFFCILFASSVLLHFSLESYYIYNWKFNFAYTQVVRHGTFFDIIHYFLINLFHGQQSHLDFFRWLRFGLLFPWLFIIFDFFKSRSKFRIACLLPVAGFLLVSGFFYGQAPFWKDYWSMMAMPLVFFPFALYVPRTKNIFFGKKFTDVFLVFGLALVILNFSGNFRRMVVSLNNGEFLMLSDSKRSDIASSFRKTPDLVNLAIISWEFLFSGARPKIGLNVLPFIDPTEGRVKMPDSSVLPAIIGSLCNAKNEILVGSEFLLNQSDFAREFIRHSKLYACFIPGVQDGLCERSKARVEIRKPTGGCMDALESKIL